MTPLPWRLGLKVGRVYGWTQGIRRMDMDRAGEWHGRVMGVWWWKEELDGDDCQPGYATQSALPA
ncbi:hypothetical protein BY996DRAFT_6592700 [Phakopsora pachyrhizi]|nr:hypothetical protein BY996DRAFT_6592700 [Phakopsora pachyrhizi]